MQHSLFFVGNRERAHYVASNFSKKFETTIAIKPISYKVYADIVGTDSQSFLNLGDAFIDIDWDELDQLDDAYCLYCEYALLERLCSEFDEEKGERNEYFLMCDQAASRENSRTVNLPDPLWSEDERFYDDRFDDKRFDDDHLDDERFDV